MSIENNCLKKLTRGPTKPCSMAINKLRDIKNNDRKKKKHSCVWFINNIKAKNCFWKFISMPENQKDYSIKEIAQLMHCTLFNCYLARASALKKLKKYFKNEYSNLETLLK